MATKRSLSPSPSCLESTCNCVLAMYVMMVMTRVIQHHHSPSLLIFLAFFPLTFLLPLPLLIPSYLQMRGRMLLMDGLIHQLCEYTIARWCCFIPSQHPRFRFLHPSLRPSSLFILAFSLHFSRLPSAKDEQDAPDDQNPTRVDYGALSFPGMSRPYFRSTPVLSACPLVFFFLPPRAGSRSWFKLRT